MFYGHRFPNVKKIFKFSQKRFDMLQKMKEDWKSSKKSEVNLGKGCCLGYTLLVTILFADTIQQGLNATESLDSLIKGFTEILSDLDTTFPYFDA